MTEAAPFVYNPTEEEPPSSNGVKEKPPSVSGIRAWAADHGFTLGERGRIPADVQEAYEKAQGGRPAAAKVKPNPAATFPTRAGRRSAAPLLTPLWAFLGSRAPGRMGGAMVWEAPAAGAILDKALAGTVIDRLILQRVSDVDKYEDLGMLLALPLIGRIVDQDPEKAANNPMLVAVTRRAALKMIGAAVAEQKRSRDEMARLDKIAKESGYEEGVAEALDAFMEAFFGGVRADEPASS